LLQSAVQVGVEELFTIEPAPLWPRSGAPTSGKRWLTRTWCIAVANP